MTERLASVGLSAAGISAARRLMWKAILLGATLYLALDVDPARNLRLNVVAYIVALVWSYYDGVFLKRHWLSASIEAVALYVAAVQVGRLLSMLFGEALFAVP